MRTRRTAVLALIGFALLSGSCGKGAKPSDDGNTGDTGDQHKPSLPVSGIQGTITVVPHEVDPERMARLRRAAFWAEGEAIVIPRGKFSISAATEALKGTDLAIASPQVESPYFLVRSEKIKQKWLRMLKGNPSEGTSGDLRADLATIRSETVSMVTTLMTKKETFLTVVPNHIRRPSLNRYQWALSELNMPTVWENFGAGALPPNGKSKKESVVAVVDSGVWVKHPNLDKNLLLSDAFDFISDPDRDRDEQPGIDANPNEPIDQLNEAAFHGTHVAGIISAYSDPRAKIGEKVIQIDGVASGVKILPIRALGWDGGTDFDIAQAILYSAGLPNVSGKVPSRKADVINLSLGGAGDNPVLEDAIHRATAAGVVVVAAAGNEGTDQPSYPAAYSQVISVGAFGPGGQFASYSNRGPNVDVMAPGGGYPPFEDRNEDEVLDGVLSTFVDRTAVDQPAYDYLSGTSMASPYVAGIVALLRSLNPQLSVADIRNLLFSNAALNGLSGCGEGDCGRGQVDVLALLNAAKEASPSAAKIVVDKDWVVMAPGNPTQRVHFANSGGGVLDLLSAPNIILRPSVASSWLSVSAERKDDGLDVVLEVNEAGAGGLPQATVVDVITNAGEIVTKATDGDKQISRSGILRLYVSYEPIDSMHVVLLRASSNDKTPQAWTATSKDKGFVFRFDEPPSGDYWVYAGRDDDGDGEICGIGDFCGAYRSPEKLQALQVQGGVPISGIDFEVTPNYFPGLSIPILKPTGGL